MKIMKNNYLSFSKREAFSIIVVLLSLTGIMAQPVSTQTFSYTGAVQIFTPNVCANQVTVEVWGAEGGGSPLSGNASSGPGGKGGYSIGTLTLVPNSVLYIYVGGFGASSTSGPAAGGFNGGGSGYASSAGEPGNGGGGATDVRVNAQALSNRVIVAGGGGGGGEDSGDPVGNGGGLTGAGYAAWDATQSAAGPNGALGIGATTNLGDGGGGGGGYYGGGSPGAASIGTDCQGGGGGSGYIGGVQFGSTIAGNASMPNPAGGTMTGRSGNGFVRITYVAGNSIAASSSPSVICTGGTATLTSTGVSTYTWNTGANTPTIAVSPTVNSTYTVSGTDALGCTSSVAVNVFVNSSVPNLTLTQSATSVCATKPVTLTASGALTYTWTNGVTNGVSYVPSATSDYTVTGGNACGTSTAVTSVTVLTLPSVSATASSPSVCSGGTVILSGSGATGYTWNPNVGNNTTFTPQTTTNYTVTGLGANGCTNTAVVNVLVLVTPTIAPVATPTAICVGATSTISALGAIGYSWTAPNFAGSNNFSVAVSPTVTTTYTLERANGTCTSTTLLNVVVNNLPILFLSPPSTVCACTGSAALTVVGGITYTWFPSGASGSQLTVYPCSTTNYTVGASNSFCSTYSTVLVTTSPNPTITITPTSPSICVGGTVGLTAGGAPNFTWTTQPVATILPNNAIITDTPAQSKLYTATGSSTAGCVASAAQVIIVNPNPNLIVTSSNPFVCNGALTTLSAVNSVTQNPAPTVSYSWSTNQITPSISVNPTISTNYTVSGTYTTGCKTTSVYPLTVYIATFVVNTPSALCSGSTATLTATGAATNFVWGTIPVQTSSVALVSPTLTTVYTVTGTTGQCSVVKTVTVPINPIPPVSITTPKWVICLFDGADLTANGALTYTWNTGEVGPSINFTTTGNGGPNGNPTTTTSFTVTGTDVNGCAKTVSATVFVSNCTGVDELNGSVNNHLEIYPNPNNGNFVVKADAPVQLTIINELGQNIRNVELTETLKEVNVTGLANGVYFIMGQNNGTRIAKKIVVNN